MYPLMYLLMYNLMYPLLYLHKYIFLYPLIYLLKYPVIFLRKYPLKYLLNYRGTITASLLTRCIGFLMWRKNQPDDHWTKTWVTQSICQIH